jgi:hypothetical protein
MWPPDANRRSEQSRARAEAGEIPWEQHHRNEQGIRRVLYIKTTNGCRDECDICQAREVQIFTFHLETWFGMLFLSICRRCGERMASQIDARLEFMTKKKAIA